MTGFSPLLAATEGLRVIRREPTALVGWIAVWGLALLTVGVLRVLTLPAAAVTPTAGVATLVDRFGPLWPILVGTILVLWIMTTATLFRAVLRPDEHGWHLFKLGADEARLGGLTAAASLLLLAVGSGPALILWQFLAKPVLHAAPGAADGVVVVGTLATVLVELWIAVRLSLAAVHTFAEGRFHLLGYWRLTRGQFWRLLISYALVFLEVVAVVVAVGVVGLLLGLAVSSIGVPHGLDLLRRALLFTFVGAAALLGAVLFVVPLTLVCACQAMAYAAIIRPNPAAPWGESRRRAWPFADARMPSDEV